MSILSRIFYADGRVAEYQATLAYLIWLNVPGTAIRVSGDTRQVMGWEFNAGVQHEDIERSRARNIRTRWTRHQQA